MQEQKQIIMADIPEYQKDYSLHAPAVLNGDVRLTKVKKMLSILEDAGLLQNTSGIAMDIGCSGGFFINALPEFFARVIGIDIDIHALRLAKKSASQHERITLLAADSMRIPVADDSIDLVICNHVYEHVPDADQLFSEIYRILKPGGVCYFGAASRLTVVEPHYHLPFLSWLPKPLAHLYMRAAGKGDFYYENLRTCDGIRKLVSKFSVNDYTLKIVTAPDKFNARDLIRPGSLLERIPLAVWRMGYRMLPGYIYLLTKRMD